MAFPETSALIDDFARANNPVNAGAGAAIWSGGINSAPNNLNIVAEQASANSGNGRTVASFGPDCEFYLEVPELPANNEGYIFIAARINKGGEGTWEGYGLIAIRVPGEWIWQIRRYTSGSSTVLGGKLSGQAISKGDIIGFNLKGKVLTGLYKPVSGPMESVGTREDATYNNAGPMGLESTSTTRMDNLRGGTLGGEPIIIDGAVSIEGSGSVEAVGSVAKAGAATVAGSGTVSCAGSLAVSGACSIAGSGTVGAVGSLAKNGSLLVSGSGAVSGVGSQALAGAATVSGAGSINIEGSSRLNGAVNVTGQGLVTAVGSVRTNGEVIVEVEGEFSFVGSSAGSDNTYEGLQSDRTYALEPGENYGGSGGSSYDG